MQQYFVRITPVMLILFSAMIFSGCIYSRDMVRSKNMIERGHPEIDLDYRFTMSVGPRFLHSMGWIARRVPEEEAFLAGSYLRHLDRVKVAIYDVDYYDEGSRSNRAAVVDFERNGWTLAVRASEDDESTWVLYREDSDANVRDIKVIVLTEEELVIARVEGVLNSLLDEVVNDQDIIRDLF